jgi:hypothetical protein
MLHCKDPYQSNKTGLPSFLSFALSNLTMCYHNDSLLLGSTTSF